MIHHNIITSMKQISTHMTFQYETLEFTNFRINKLYTSSLLPNLTYFLSYIQNCFY